MTADDLSRAGSKTPIMVGGAALSRKFVDTKIAPKYAGGLVTYARDAMDGLDLAKRIVRANPSTSKSRLEHMTAPTLVQIAGNMKSRAVPKDKQQKDVTILDLFENAASVKIVANDWIDYLHVSKFDGRWVIVNVLWEMKHRKK